MNNVWNGCSSVLTHSHTRESEKLEGYHLNGEEDRRLPLGLLIGDRIKFNRLMYHSKIEMSPWSQWMTRPEKNKKNKKDLILKLVTCTIQFCNSSNKNVT